MTNERADEMLEGMKKPFSITMTILSTLTSGLQVYILFSFITWNKNIIEWGLLTQFIALLLFGYMTLAKSLVKTLKKYIKIKKTEIGTQTDIEIEVGND